MTSVSNARKLATWHSIVHTLDVLIATIMDTLQWIALTRHLLQACQHDVGITPLVDMTGQHLRTTTPDILTVTVETGTDSANLDLAHITPDIEVTVAVIPTEAILVHFFDLHAVAPHFTEDSAHTTTMVTHHITDPHHADISPEKTVDPAHIDPAGNILNPHKDHLPIHSQCPGSLRDRRNKQVTIDDPPPEYTQLCL